MVVRIIRRVPVEAGCWAINESSGALQAALQDRLLLPATLLSTEDVPRSLLRASAELV